MRRATTRATSSSRSRSSSAIGTRRRSTPAGSVVGGEAQQHAARDRLLRGVEAGEGVLGVPRHRAADAARGLVGREPHLAAVAALPELEQRGGEHRQRARLVLDVGDQRLGELGLDPQPDPVRRALDGTAQLVARMAPTSTWCAARSRRAPGRPRSARSSPRGSPGRRSAPRARPRTARRRTRALGLVAARRERLLELIDHQQRAAVRSDPARGGRELARRMLAGPDHDLRPGLRCPAAPRRRAPAAARRAPPRTCRFPDGPTTPSSGAPTSRATSSATSRSRPKKYGASTTSKDARPLNGHTHRRGTVVVLGALRRRLQRDDARPRARPPSSTAHHDRPRSARPSHRHGARPRAAPTGRDRSCTRRGTPPLASSSPSVGNVPPARAAAIASTRRGVQGPEHDRIVRRTPATARPGRRRAPAPASRPQRRELQAGQRVAARDGSRAPTRVEVVRDDERRAAPRRVPRRRAARAGRRPAADRAGP